MIAADYSSARPNLQALRDAGYTVIFRYLGEFNDARCITPNELNGLHAAGFRVALIFESSASRPLSGRDGGRADAQRANAWADRIGAPATSPIFYAVDFSPSAAQLLTVTDYFRGVLEAGGRPVGEYGCYDVVETLARLQWAGRTVEHHWQCAAWSGGGNGTGGSIRTGYANPVRLSAAVCAFQHYGLTGGFGSSIDHNDVLNGPPDWAWHPSITATPHEESKYMAKIVFCPEHTGGVGWLTLPGLLRVGLPDEVVAAAMTKAGQADGMVELTGGEAWQYLWWHMETTLQSIHWGAVQLMTTGVERNTEATTRIVTEALGNLQAPALPDGFAHDVAAEVLPELGEALGNADFLNKVRDAAAAGVDQELDAIKD